jgi:toxin FitB
VTATIGSEYILIDSSGWLEYITGDTKAALFSPYFASDSRRILVSPIVIYEVRKLLLLRHSKRVADEFVSQAMRHQLVPLDDRIALDAATLSIDHCLPMADALIYATAGVAQAQLITSDAHFNNLPGVTVL